MSGTERDDRRTSHGYECDHMRQVVFDESACRWRHIVSGSLASECTAGVYLVTVHIEGDHVITSRAHNAD